MDDSQNPREQEIRLPKSQRFSPSEFMRARRPELFSDSRVIQEPCFSKEVFEYHLDSLTSRKQETEFEHFCRRLAEKEICPNLRPQTGPTGGGDSKVDSETYPVADEIALRWYEGLGREASQEQWGFAFSAKKDWRTKARADVNAIAEVYRNYKRIYFISNQFAKDKTRKQLEEQLSKEAGVPITILDRTWITKCIFEHEHFRLASETLSMSCVESTPHKVTGPRDAEREVELNELEAQINDAGRYNGVKFQLAEDCLRSALLARGLERPRVEIEGRFARAARIAEEAGHPQQRLRIAYNKAWTAANWFDDFQEFNRLYDTVEQLALASRQATDLELLANLCSVLYTCVIGGQLDASDAKLDERAAKLRNALEVLASDSSRPNNALWARANRLFMDIPAAARDKTRMAAVLQEFRLILSAADGLIAFPLEPVAKIIQELGTLLTDNAHYDDLLEALIDLTERRTSESEAGKLLLDRGYQKLRNTRPYDAIRFLGRASQKLAKRECREELVSALLGCGMAYEMAGLLWAARASALAAANQALSEFIEEGTILPQALRCIRKLVWQEIELGRVPCVLQWMEVSSVIAQQLALTDDRKKQFVEEREDQDRILAILFLKADLTHLRSLSFLPRILEGSGLLWSWMALLYALGYEDLLRAQGVIPECDAEGAVRELFAKWVAQPAAEDLPGQPQLLSGESLNLRSRVLGCEVTVHTDNSLRSLFLGEQILAALEGLLATSLERRIFPHSQEFRINIEVSDAAKAPGEYGFDRSRGDKTLNIKRPAAMAGKSAATNSFVWLQEIVLQILPRIAIVDDLESYAKQVFGEEAALSRAFNFSDPSIPIENILGEKPRLRLADWEEETKGETFHLKRDSPWNNVLEQADETTKPERELRFGAGEPPEELFDFGRIKHSKIQVMSLINLPLWDEAGWRGVLYLVPVDLDELPIMALAFSDSRPAREIFEEWRVKLGEVDTDEQLRVAVITGIHKDNPFRYKVVIGSERVPPEGRGPGSLIIQASRIREMDPQASTNLDNFLVRFRRHGRFFLAPALLPRSPGSPQVFFDLSVGKQRLYVRPAWQVGENDPDMVAIEPDDDPIIPDGVENPPVIRALVRIRKSK